MGVMGNEFIKEQKTLKTLYHATPKNNTFAIMREGIKAGIDGIVYFCETPENCLAYMRGYVIAHGFHEFATIPVKFTDEEFANMGKNIDNTAELPTAYAYEGDISADRVPHNLNKIPLWVMSL